MDKIDFYKLSEEDKIAFYKNVGNQTGIPDFAVEKDWWVVQTLNIIFEMEVSKHLVFKGGTSLSKAWKSIERFSEDIDLAIDRSFFGYNGELSKKQRTKLRKDTSTYISESFYPELQKKFKKRGFEDVNMVIAPPKSSDQDPRIIEIYYPHIMESPGYIESRVLVEIGCRSLREPFETKPILSFIDEQYPNSEFVLGAMNVPSVVPERTFLEKLFQLYEEFQRPEEKIRVERLSRHLYDIYQLSKTGYADNAFQDKELYETIVSHRYIFTKVGGVDYNLHQPQTLNPIPPPEIADAWKTDYKLMQEQMIYGDSPSYEDLIVQIESVRKKFKAMEWTFTNEYP